MQQWMKPETGTRARLWGSLVILLTLLSVAQITNAADVITISYWQPNPGAIRRDVAIDELIKAFEAENPGIRVIHRYEFATGKYLAELDHLIPAGEGPDVVTMFYGWIPSWVNAGYLIPLPRDHFSNETIEAQFFPIVQQSEFQGRYWALPSAVRTMGLFYNPVMFDAAGVPYPDASWTIDDMAAAAEAIDGILPDIVGFDLDPRGWGHHWLREVMVPLFDGGSYIDHPRSEIWNSPQACEALTWVLNLEANPNTTVDEYTLSNNTPAYYFSNGLSAMHVDGSFRIATIDAANLNNDPNTADLQYGVAPLPRGRDGEQRTFGSYWTHGLTPRVMENKDRLDASIRFLQYITSAEAGAMWVEITGELPAQKSAIDAGLLNDPYLGPFAAGLEYAYATPFADETAQRDFLIAAYDRIIRDNADPCVALSVAGSNIQEILDDFFENQERWERGSILDAAEMP